MSLSIETIVAGPAKFWTSLLSNKHVNKYLFFENFNILTLASYFMLASSALSVLHNGPILDCFATLELSSERATEAALGLNYFHPVGTNSSTDKQLSTFKWSMYYFIGSAASMIACKMLWSLLEGNHLTYLSNRFIKSRSDPEKRDQIATDIVTYVNDCEIGQHMMVKYVGANLFTLGAMVAMIYWYFDTVDFFQHPFSPSEFLNWTKTQEEDRTDIMIKVFPRTCVFQYHSTGPSGTEQYADIYCTAGINTTLEYIYATTLIIVPIVTSLQVISMILSVAAVALFHRTTDKDNELIKNIQHLTYGQRLLYTLIQKNIDDNLWYAVLSKITSNPSSNNINCANKLSVKEDRKKNLLLQCQTEKERFSKNRKNVTNQEQEECNLQRVVINSDTMRKRNKSCST